MHAIVRDCPALQIDAMRKRIIELQLNNMSMGASTHPVLRLGQY